MEIIVIVTALATVLIVQKIFDKLIPRMIRDEADKAYNQGYEDAQKSNQLVRR